MELRGEIRAQFALTPEEAAELLLSVGRASASGCGTKGAAQEQNRLTQDATMDSVIERMQRAAKKLEEQAKNERAAVKTECGTEGSAPEPADTAQEQEPAQASASASARTESAEQAEQPDLASGTPEHTITQLRETFGIPVRKEDRNEEQQQRSIELNRAVTALIREITRRDRANSLADLRSDIEKKEFVRRALTLAYDGQKFEEKPF